MNEPRPSAQEMAPAQRAPGSTLAMVLCVMLWAAPGQEQSLIEYEDRVLTLLPAHQGRLLSRVRSLDGEPFEIQLLRFASEQALASYTADPLRLELADLRERAIARTEVLRVVELDT
jgi:hypothetical protein